MSKVSINFRKAVVVTGMVCLIGGAVYKIDEFFDELISEFNKLGQAKTENGKLPQATAEFFVTEYDRRYTIWDGMVVEEFKNTSPYVFTQGSLGKRAYDFDLRMITHMSDAANGDIDVSPFSESVVNGKESPHIEHVRKLGCLVADGYFERAATGAYEPPPANIANFRAKHCVPGG